MIIRTVHNRDNPYFMMNRTSVQDAELTFKAVGIHTYLMSKPDLWSAHETDIANRHKDGLTAVRAGVKELIDRGYMLRIQFRLRKKIIGWRLDTFESPELNPYYEPGKTLAIVDLDRSGVEWPEDVAAIEVEKINLADLDCGCLYLANLDLAGQNVGKQDQGNQTNSNYGLLENNDPLVNIPPAPAVAEKSEPEQQPAPTPVPAPTLVPVVEQPTLYDGLPDSAPEKQEHLRLLGMTTKEREDKRSGHRPRHPNPMVNDQGLTQKLRTEMVNILARIHGHTALLEADEEYVLLYQDMAERLYRIRDMREDTIAKLEAFSDLYDARKRDRWGPPVKNQFLEFVSAIYEERLTGQTNGGGKTNARTNGKAGTKHESTATGLVDAYIAEHGPIDINTPYPPGYRQWPDAERERFFELKYPPQLLPEVSGGVEGE